MPTLTEILNEKRCKNIQEHLQGYKRKSKQMSLYLWTVPKRSTGLIQNVNGFRSRKIERRKPLWTQWHVSLTIEGYLVSMSLMEFKPSDRKTGNANGDKKKPDA